MTSIDRFHVEACPLAEMNGFGEALHKSGNGDLVAHLGKLAGAGRSEQPPHPRIMGDQRFGLGVIHLVATAHDGEDAILGAGLTARYRRIDETKTATLGFGMQLARNTGRCGGVVDEHGTRLHGMEGAFSSNGHLPQIVVIADAGEDEIGIGCRRAGCCSRGAAMGGLPFFSLARAAVIDRDGAAAALCQMAGHRKPHHAQTDPCGTNGHCTSPSG